MAKTTIKKPPKTGPSRATTLILTLLVIMVALYAAVQIAGQLNTPYRVMRAYYYEADDETTFSGYVVRRGEGGGGGNGAPQPGGRRAGPEPQRRRAGGQGPAPRHCVCRQQRRGPGDGAGHPVRPAGPAGFCPWSRAAAPPWPSSWTAASRAASSPCSRTSTTAVQRPGAGRFLGGGPGHQAGLLRRRRGRRSAADQRDEVQQRIDTLEAQQERNARAVSAPVSGIFSAVVDGYETVLTPAALETMTPRQLAGIQATAALPPTWAS